MHRRSLPLFSEAFGLHPWDLDELTPSELAVYVNRLNQMSRDGES